MVLFFNLVMKLALPLLEYYSAYLRALKRPSAIKAGELLNLSRNELQKMTGLLTGHCHMKGYLHKLGIVNSPECDRCKQESEMASHVLCDCETLATLRFRQLGRHFM
jgi:hypothetical protein